MTVDAGDRWLFAPRSVAGLSLFRVLLGLILLQRWLPRLPHVSELYTREAPTAATGWMAVLGLSAPSNTLATTLFCVLIVALICLTLGLLTRPAAAVAGLLVWYFVNVHWVFACAVDSYGIMALVLMAVGPAGHMYSVDAWLAGRRGAPLSTSAPPWAQRLVCLVFLTPYVFAPILRVTMNGFHFFGGDPLASAFRRWQFVTDASAFVADQPVLMVLIAVGSTLGEWFIVVALFNRRLRPYGIAFGLTLHGFVLVSVLIPPGLSLIMMASYVLFLEPESVERLLTRRRPQDAQLR